MDSYSANKEVPSKRLALSLDKIRSKEAACEVDVQSIESIYQKYHRSVFRVCIGLLKNKEDAEDATHEVFLSVMDNVSSFRRESGLFTWMYAIAVNASLRLIKKKRRFDVSHLLPELSAHKGFCGDNAIDAKNAVNWLFKTSNQRMQLFLLLRYVNGLTQEEIGEVLCINSRTVRSMEKKIGMKLRHSRYHSIR